MQLAFESFLTLDPSSLLPPSIECIVLFAGGGGTSLGYTFATGREPDLAINHDLHAIRLHQLNHPHTLHLREDVRARTPESIVRGRPVRLVAASPDCTHFSNAKGKKPLKRGRRALAGVVVQWARETRPDFIVVENVQEFTTWGPLYSMTHPDPALRGRPIKERAGEFFQAWLRGLKRHGYSVEWRVLSAADFGAPTSRRRLFIVARRDGKPVHWPTPTHGPGRAAPWRTAAECIDWSIPCPSIFNRRKPLAEATHRRIAEGIRRFILKNPHPFLVRQAQDSETDSPVVPLLVQIGYGERPGQRPRALDIEAPLGTVVAGGSKHGLVTVHLAAAPQNDAPVASSLHAPVLPVTSGGPSNRLVAAWIAKHYGNGVVGHGLQQPLGTITTVDHHSLCTASLSPLADAGAERVAAFLIKYYGNGGQWQSPGDPLDTVVTKARFGLVTVHIKGEPYVITDIGMRMLQPRELARAMGFPESYVLEGSKEDQIARIGNAVCPPVASALISALLGEVTE